MGILFYNFQVLRESYFFPYRFRIYTLSGLPPGCPEGPSMSAGPKAPDPAPEAYNLNFLFLKPQFLVASTHSGLHTSEKDCICQLLSHVPFSLTPSRGLTELLWEQMNVTVMERLTSHVMPPKTRHNHPEVQLGPVTVNQCSRSPWVSKYHW